MIRGHYIRCHLLVLFFLWNDLEQDSPSLNYITIETCWCCYCATCYPIDLCRPRGTRDRFFLTTRGFATLHTLAKIGVDPGGAVWRSRQSVVPLFGGSKSSVTIVSPVAGFSCPYIRHHWE